MDVRLSQTRTQVARRLRQIHSTWRAEGVEGIARRTRSAIVSGLGTKDVVLPVFPADVLAADLGRPFHPPSSPRTGGEPLTVNWVTTPPSAGSGGHSTLFRIVNYLSSKGYQNRVYFYDVYGGDHQYYASIVRDSYGFEGPIAPVQGGMADADAVVASAWPTAYAVYNARCSGKRFYFVQDYEPSFHATGALSVMAENTYRMGFEAITAGAWIAGKLRAEYGMRADHFEFGCDLSRYGLKPGSPRQGVAFYARPDAPRRGFELGIMALEVFAKRNPGVPLHLYGEKLGKLPFPCVQHGRVTPGQLNDIYNRCHAGLSLSLTNVSLVPHEMLAAGCIPVVNDAAQNRLVLDNPFVRYAALNPHALAAQIEQVIATPDFDSLARAAAASVRSTSWDDAGRAVDAILRRAVTG